MEHLDLFHNMNKQFKSYKFEDYASALTNNIGKGINCHRIGAIRSFNPETQRATVQIIDYLYLPDLPDNEIVKITPTLLINVPVQINCTTLGGMKIPINEGDFCLLAFNDRDLNNWLESGNTENTELASFRTHDFSDGIAIMSIFPDPNVLLNYNNEATELFYGENTRILLEEEIVTITNTSSTIELDASGNANINCNTLNITTASGSASLDSNGNLTISGNTFTIGGLILSVAGGKLLVNGKEVAVVGGTTVGNAATQTITVSGQ